MSNVVSPASTATSSATTATIAVSARANALAERLEQGVNTLVDLAIGLSDSEWRTPVSVTDRRTVGQIVNHVALVFPVEIHFAQVLGNGDPIVGVTWDTVHEMNGNHARENANPTREEAVTLLRQNGAAAAAAIRALGDRQLDAAAPNSMYADAPTTCQFMLEDHAVRHSYHHTQKIRRALGK
jgi:hypothetical protein